MTGVAGFLLCVERPASETVPSAFSSVCGRNPRIPVFIYAAWGGVPTAWVGPITWIWRYPRNSKRYGGHFDVFKLSTQRWGGVVNRQQQRLPGHCCVQLKVVCGKDGDHAGT